MFTDVQIDAVTMSDDSFFCQTCNQKYHSVYSAHCIIINVYKLEKEIPKLTDGVGFTIKVCVHCANETKKNFIGIQSRTEKKEEKKNVESDEKKQQ